MNKYIIGVIIFTIIFLFALFNFSNTQNQKLTKVASAVTVVESSYDFGEIDIFGGKVSTTYTLRNEGTEDIRILSGTTSCACTEGKIGGLEFSMHKSSGEYVIIEAGKEEMLTAIFDPLAHGPSGVGKIKREMYLKTNSTITPEIKVTFTADVIKSEK